MIKFGKIIDKLIEISMSDELSGDARSQLDLVIEELVEFEVDQHNGLLPIDYRELSPEELEEIREFEMFVRDVMNDNLALAWFWNEMREYNHNDTVMVSGKDLNKIIAITRTLMDLKPNLNASLMDFYCYLNELKPTEKSLDEIIYEIGMTCPSWSDDLEKLN